MPLKPAAPVDITATHAWKALNRHYKKLTIKGIDLKEWFDTDPDRVAKLSFDTSDLHFDLSKNLVTDKTIKLLLNLAAPNAGEISLFDGESRGVALRKTGSLIEEPALVKNASAFENLKRFGNNTIIHSGHSCVNCCLSWGAYTTTR